MSIKSFTDLLAWQKAHVLVLMVYRLTTKFPSNEQFGLTSQIRRAAVSITSNIAEGFGRQTYGERVQFYGVAKGSLTEVQNQLLVARDVGYLPALEFDKVAGLAVEVHKLLHGLLRKSRVIRDA